MDNEIRRLERLGPSVALLKAYQRAGLRKQELDCRAVLGYYAEVAALPMPTDIQARRFVRFLAGAHSWYKHLGNEPQTFYLFLNPCVSKFVVSNGDLVAGEEGCTETILGSECKRVQSREAKVGDRELFHYNSFPTKRYIEAFGHLDFCYYTTPTIWSEEGIEIIPDPIELGRVGLTRHVHYPFPSGWKQGEKLEKVEIPETEFEQYSGMREFEQYSGMREFREKMRAEHEAIYQAIKKHLEDVLQAKHEIGE